MITPLAVAITLVGLLGGLAVGAMTLAGTYRWARTAPTLAIVEIALLVLAVGDVVSLVRGHRPSEQATHLAYVVTSVPALPIVAGQVRGDDGRWSGAIVAAALVVVAVLVVRLAATWRPA